MKQVNIRIGKQPFSDQFVCEINGIPKPLEPTLKLALLMQVLGVNNEIAIDGDILYVAKFLIEDDRIIAEAHSEKHY